MNIQKEILRKEIKNRLKNMSQLEKQVESAYLLSLLEKNKDFIHAKTILLYWSLEDEVHTHDFIKKWSKKKLILLPAILNNELVLKKYSSNMSLGKYKIAEPMGDVFLNYEKIDLAIIPGLAFDKNNNRLGRGKGYYDKLLKNLSLSIKIGLCFACQLVEKVPIQTWDIPMNKICKKKKSLKNFVF